MTWRLALGLEKLRAQVNARWPTRSKESDGSIMLLKRQDHRLKYVISNRHIGSGPAGPQPGLWRPYSGKNPHDHQSIVIPDVDIIAEYGARMERSPAAASPR